MHILLFITCQIGFVERNFHILLIIFTFCFTFASKPLSSSYVAKYAIDKMFQNKVIIIPGFKMKLVTFFRRLAPRNLILKITYNFQRRKKP